MDGSRPSEEVFRRPALSLRLSSSSACFPASSSPFPGAFLLFCSMIFLRLSPFFIFPLETSIFLSFPGVLFLSRHRRTGLSHLFPPSAFLPACDALLPLFPQHLVRLSVPSQGALAHLWPHRPLATPACASAWPSNAWRSFTIEDSDLFKVCTESMRVKC